MNEVRRRGRPSVQGSKAQKGVQALERGIAILSYLADSDASTSISDIAERLDLPLSTAFRLLKALETAGFVYQDPQLGWWQIGLTAFTVGSSYIRNRDVVAIASPSMRRLMLLSGETVNIAIRNGREAVLIGQVECQSILRMCAPLGNRLPLHASGVGKALLYPLMEEELLDFTLNTELTRFTANTLADLHLLKDDLVLSEERGYSVDEEEHATGLNCIASAIYDHTGMVIAGISISGPSTRLTAEKFISLGKLVKEAASSISTALGLTVLND